MGGRRALNPAMFVTAAEDVGLNFHMKIYSSKTRGKKRFRWAADV